MMCLFFFFLMIRRPPRSTQSRSSAASDVYKRQLHEWQCENVEPVQQIVCFENSLPRIEVSYGRRYVNADGLDRGDFCSLTFDGHVLVDCLLYTSPSPRD